MISSDDDLDIVKKRKEIEKLEVDIGNAKANLALERLKAWASLLGPVMTAITVLGTVYLGFLQIWAKSDSDEDANWRQTISAANETNTAELSTRHVATLLKPFLESKRYRTLAIGVVIDELPRVRDVDTFKDLLSAVFPRYEPKDLTIILDLARKQTTFNVKLQNAVNSNLDESSKGAKRDERSIVVAESSVLCGPIADILRNYDHKAIEQYFSPGQTASSKIPMDNIFFEKCDFSGIDFSDISLDHSTFDFVKLDNAVLKNVTGYAASSAYLWNSNIWWNAKEIDSDLLQSLLARFKPYAPRPKDFSTGYRDGAIIKQEDWDRNIQRLCLSAHLTCTDEQIRADFPTNS